jgi:RNA polymerase sigma-70 factor (ECF subfamily)
LDGGRPQITIFRDGFPIVSPDIGEQPMPAPVSNQYEALRFEDIFEAELPYVWTSLRRLGVAPRDLEDVAHELFIQVAERLPACDTSRPIRPWLFAFAIRFAADYRRLARHKTDFIGGLEPTDASPSPEALLTERERHGLVLRALEAIDLDRRAVFIMHELDENPIPVIATTLGIPLNTCYSRLRTAREEFTAAVRRLTQRGKDVP